jgi:ATP-binding cassette, subfamily B, bacterial
MQEGFIFSDSISNNIGVIDDIPIREKLEKAVTTANIKEFIESLPLGYETKDW